MYAADYRIVRKSINRKARFEQERQNQMDANEQKLMEQFKEKIKQDILRLKKITNNKKTPSIRSLFV